MLKKSLITIIVFFILAIISNPVFATNLAGDAQNTLNNIRGGVQNMASDTGNSIEHAKDGISNMLNNGVNDAKNTTSNVENDSKNIMNDVTGNDYKGTASTDNGYTATRTSTADATSTTTSNTATIWVVLAVVGIIIVALVWYYGAQTQNTRDHF